MSYELPICHSRVISPYSYITLSPAVTTHAPANDQASLHVSHIFLEPNFGTKCPSCTNRTECVNVCIKKTFTTQVGKNISGQLRYVIVAI